MEPIDHTQTMVLLIGVSEFPEDTTINPIPNVLTNVQLLKSSLTDPELIGIPEANISVSVNEDKSKIERKLKKICELTRDRRFTLLIYYSGHGILSSTDFKLYLTTHHTIRSDLEIDGVHIDTFKKYVRRSRAAIKIVILDCCHSGAYIETMGDVASIIQAGINDFEGTYIMTSAAADEPALFPVGHPEQPTYFTGKLVKILHEGLDNEQQFCTLRDIYDKIEYDFETEGLPQPQQSSVNTVDQFIFSKNKKYVKKKPADESAWEEALKENTKWAYFDFREQYPLSVFSKQATRKISELEEEELWNDALNKHTLSAFTDYRDKYPNGKFINEANQKIIELRQLEEDAYWKQVLIKNDLDAFRNYLRRYPKGKHIELCQEQILLKRQEEDHRNEELESEIRRKRDQQEERQWNDALRSGALSSFIEYRNAYPNGTYISTANQKISALKQAGEAEQEKRFWDVVVKKGDTDSFNSYMLRYPDGRYIEDCKVEIARRRREAEAREIEDRRKQEEAVTRTLEERRKQEQTEADKKETLRKQEELLQAQRNEALRKQEEHLQAQRNEALKKQKESEAKRREAEERTKPRNLIITEEPFINNEMGNRTKELIILGAVIILLIVIFLFVIYQNVN